MKPTAKHLGPTLHHPIFSPSHHDHPCDHPGQDKENMPTQNLPQGAPLPTERYQHGRGAYLATTKAKHSTGHLGDIDQIVGMLEQHHRADLVPMLRLYGKLGSAQGPVQDLLADIDEYRGQMVAEAVRDYEAAMQELLQAMLGLRASIEELEEGSSEGGYRTPAAKGGWHGCRRTVEQLLASISGNQIWRKTGHMHETKNHAMVQSISIAEQQQEVDRLKFTHDSQSSESQSSYYSIKPFIAEINSLGHSAESHASLHSRIIDRFDFHDPEPTHNTIDKGSAGQMVEHINLVYRGFKEVYRMMLEALHLSTLQQQSRCSGCVQGRQQDKQSKLLSKQAKLVEQLYNKYKRISIENQSLQNSKAGTNFLVVQSRLENLCQFTSECLQDLPQLRHIWRQNALLCVNGGVRRPL